MNKMKIEQKKEGSEHRLLSRLFHGLIVAGTKEWYMELVGRKDGVEKKDENDRYGRCNKKNIKVKKHKLFTILYRRQSLVTSLRFSRDRTPVLSSRSM